MPLHCGKARNLRIYTAGHTRATPSLRACMSRVPYVMQGNCGVEGTGIPAGRAAGGHCAERPAAHLAIRFHPCHPGQPPHAALQPPRHTSLISSAMSAPHTLHLPVLPCELSPDNALPAGQICKWCEARLLHCCRSELWRRIQIPWTQMMRTEGQLHCVSQLICV